jgi:vacuolar-type H+-ATPase subunit C/Vma6
MENIMALKEVDRIISEVNKLDEEERNIFIKKIEKLYRSSKEAAEEDDPVQSVFGLWKDYDITKETLRAKAWRQN